ncbi:MAG: T9SS type A sorting domain-containing protein [Bacteroidia bacterium]|jgi:hypothetical protein|nr:T9SS type A sorting domain-containing protein [Bacteroidia bacterium]
MQFTLTPFNFRIIQIFMSGMLLFSTLYVKSQNTYTWNVTRGNWNTPTNWTPARTTPSINDILVFNGLVTPSTCVDSVIRVTVGKLRFINNINVRLIAAPRILGAGSLTRTGNVVTGVGTSFLTDLTEGDLIFNTSTTLLGEVATITSNNSLTTNANSNLASTSYTYANSINVNDGTANALEVSAGSIVTIGDSGAEPLVIRALSGSKGLISGTIRMLYSRQRLIGIDSASMIVASGGVIRTDSSFVGNAFSPIGKNNTVVFNSNSNYEFVAGANPFALTSPNSKVLFGQGSRFWQLSNGVPSIAGRSYGTYIFNPGLIVNVTGTQNNVGSFDSIIISSGQFNLNSSNLTTIGNIVVNSGGVFNLNQSASTFILRGNILVNNGGKLNLNGFNSGAPASFCFRGSTPQQITGSGELRISNTNDSLLRIRIQNLSGLTLNRSINLNASILDLDSGFLDLNNYTLTIGSASFNGRATQLNGTIRGSGSITKWYQATNFGASDSTLFPVGSATSNFPLWVFGSVTNQGTVTLTSFIENAGVTTITPSFNDTAPSSIVSINRRLNHSWSLQTGNGLASSNLSIRIGFPAVANSINNVQDVRVTLANSTAPGTSEDGSGTTTSPFANRSGISAAALNNTFFIGSNNSGNPLPVEFLSVVGKLNKDIAHLNWVVTSERNVSHYNVKYKYDNEPFVVLGKVMANGNTAVKQTYTYESEKGPGCYMIEAVDFDGETTLSSLVCLTNTNNYGLVSIFPNPAKQSVNILGLNSTETIILELYSVKGEMYNITVKDGVADISNLPEGIYAGLITQGEQRLKVRIVKQQ